MLLVMFSQNRKLQASGATSLRSTDHLLAGIEAGVILVFLTNPLWLIKTRLQLQGVGVDPTKRYKGPIGRCHCN